AAMAQQGPNPGAVMILGLALMVCFVGALMVVGAEVCALVSLARIGDGLKAPSAAAWARQSIAALVVLIGLLTVGFCTFAIYVAHRQEGKQKQGANNPPLGRGKHKRKANNRAEGRAKDAAPPPNGQVQPPNQQQQNPFDDNAVDPETEFAAQGVMIGLVLLYLLHFSVGLQKVRRAIRREIDVLTGNEQRQDDQT